MHSRRQATGYGQQIDIKIVLIANHLGGIFIDRSDFDAGNPLATMRDCHRMPCKQINASTFHGRYQRASWVWAQIDYCHIGTSLMQCQRGFISVIIIGKDS